MSRVSHSGPPRTYTRAREGWQDGPCRVIHIEGSQELPRRRQSGCMASIGGGSEIVLYGGWAGGDELGDLWVLKLGGLDDKIYRYSTGSQLTMAGSREEYDRGGAAPRETRVSDAALRMRLIQMVTAMQASPPTTHPPPPHTSCEAIECACCCRAGEYPSPKRAALTCVCCCLAGKR